MKKMEEQPLIPEKEKKPSWPKIIIVVLAVLLLLSIGGLAARYIYINFFAPSQATVTIPDNLIGEENSSGTTSLSLPENSAGEGESSSVAGGENSSGMAGNGNNPSGTASTPNSGTSVDKPQAAVLELYQGRPGDNKRFRVLNMLPGDNVTQYFCVKAYHEQDITLYFKTNITEQSKDLGDVLHIKVTHLDTGKVLCDDYFSEVDGKAFSELLRENTQDETIAYYRIDVSVDTSVGNEYQAAGLTADFSWYVKDEGGLAPPQTGDNTNVVLWGVLAVSSAGIVLLLLVRRKEEKSHEQA